MDYATTAPHGHYATTAPHGNTPRRPRRMATTRRPRGMVIQGGRVGETLGYSGPRSTIPQYVIQNPMENSAAAKTFSMGKCNTQTLWPMISCNTHSSKRGISIQVDQRRLGYRSIFDRYRRVDSHIHTSGNDLDIWKNENQQ